MSDLTRQRDHFRTMASDLERDPGERELCTQMADEIDVYLAPNTDDDEPLFTPLTLVPEESA